MATPFSYRFPIDLGASAGANYPFVQFTIAQFAERTLLRDLSGKSSIVDPTQLAAIQTQKVNAAQSIQNPNPNLYGPPAPSTGITTIGNIYLPLPQSLMNDYHITWEMTNMVFANSLINAFHDNGNMNGLGDLGSGLLASINDITGQLSEKLTSTTPNPRKQALFNGIEPRKFTFDYTFSPQSLQEAELVQNIITSFVTWSLPSLNTATTNAFFDFPGEFQINFHGTAGFPDIRWCVCDNVMTNYTPNTLQLFSSGHSTQISLSLSFVETSLRTRESAGV